MTLDEANKKLKELFNMFDSMRFELAQSHDGHIGTLEKELEDARENLKNCANSADRMRCMLKDSEDMRVQLSKELDAERATVGRVRASFIKMQQEYSRFRDETARPHNSPVMFVTEHEAKIKDVVRASDERMKHAETYYGDRLLEVGSELRMFRASMLARIAELDHRIGILKGKGRNV